MGNKSALGIILALIGLGLIAFIAWWLPPQALKRYLLSTNHSRQKPSNYSKQERLEKSSDSESLDSRVKPLPLNKVSSSPCGSNGLGANRPIFDSTTPGSKGLSLLTNNQSPNKSIKPPTQNQVIPSSKTTSTRLYLTTSEIVNLSPGVRIPAALVEPDAKTSLDATSLKEAQATADSFLHAVDAETQEVVDVPVGVRIPAVLAQVDGKSSLDVVSQKEVQAIADSFFQAVDVETQSGVTPVLAWKNQQQLSDEMFRARYGWEAFNAESARANQQANAQ